jgi:formamidopyrimidine-DNA glycosylase
MPELPEVEAVRRGIDAQLAGKRVVAIDLRLPKLLIAPAGLGLDDVIGQPLLAIERRGKYLALSFPDMVAIVHLKLAGQVVARGPVIPGFAAGHPVPAFNAELPHKSTHLILTFEDESQLFLTDIRHFARIQLIPADDLERFWDDLKLGPDAVSSAFTLEWFAGALGRRRSARLKPLLLDQQFLAGLGNIYVDECLHRARLHPERAAAGLTAEEVERLFGAIVDVMAIAVPIGGAAILNGKALPEHGAFPFIHGREGQPCLCCGTTIVKTRVNGRGTYLCPACQVLAGTDPADDLTAP